MTRFGRPIFLWAAPRSVSTAFERIFMERGDFEVLHEPFSATYYFSTERRSERFLGEKQPQEDCGNLNVLNDVLKPRGKPLFVKDMAYFTAGFMTPELVSQFTNTFIIREPRGALVSLHEMMPDFTFEEAGYEELYRLYSHAVEAGQDPAVVDAEDLLSNSEATVRAYCEKLGIPFVPRALSWEAREVPEWKVWDGWHTDAKRSTGIGKVSRRDSTLPPELEDVYERCLPYYEKLQAVRLDISRTRSAW